MREARRELTFKSAALPILQHVGQITDQESRLQQLSRKPVSRF